ncbi:MAG: efflux RND transporter permease subunit [Candidatus Methylacidiphilales bacterium]|nr:efflux RND transporter permease subunit [Candidatus Methylacidiphilales bacterium]
MWIVRIALRMPYTFTVMAIALILAGALSFYRMPKDIFPAIDIPVVSVIWSYGGLPPKEIESRIITVSERAMTTTVNDFERMETQIFNGVAVVRVFFYPTAKIEAAVAQVTAINQTLLRTMPPGTTPPLILRYSASNVPILQMALGSETMSESELFDEAQNSVRTPLASVEGAMVPLPYGGKSRAIQVDLDLQACRVYGISPSDVSATISAQNLILPSGTAKIGDREYSVAMNSSVDTVQLIGDMPIKTVNGATIFIRDVAQVRDGSSPQTNVVRVDGRKSALLTVLKNGNASTLDVVERVKKRMPEIKKLVPEELEITPLFDQSIFVRAALAGVEHEALIAAGLTALMILLFLGSWRSTLVVAASIPLSIAVALLALVTLGQTLNIMTLGGLALAVGILVDDTTVEIENIHRNMAMGKTLVQAILDGAHQVAGPAFVATLCICIVFVPIFFLGGVAYYLFAPMAMAVVFAVMASYFLSRTIVPTMVYYFYHGREDEEHHDENADNRPTHKGVYGVLAWIHWRFNRGFEGGRKRYVRALAWTLRHRLLVVSAAAVIVAGSLVMLIPNLGQDFFPRVDAGQFRLHVRAPSGTRLEETEKIFSQVADVIREIIPKGEIKLIIDNIGLPLGGINLALSDSATIGSADGEMLISLSEEHGHTWDYVQKIRTTLRERFPDCTFFTQPSDIVGQTLNFGVPSPIDVTVVGRSPKNWDLAKRLEKEISQIPGAVDVHVHQVVDAPQIDVDVDRIRAAGVNLTQRQVAGDVLVALSGTSQTENSFWISPKNGTQYRVSVQTPQPEINSMDVLRNLPVGRMNEQQLLGNLATFNRDTTPAVVSHLTVQPVFNVYANVEGRDLGGVARDIQKIIKNIQSEKDGIPRGTQVMIRGQVDSMQKAFTGLGFGLLGAMVLVYLLLVVNFQSWLDPFIIITALPGALCGIVWMLFITSTTISVPALMGAIMAVGVATANSILVVSFANEQRWAGKDVLSAALAAGYIRLRPVCMTALAMIIGMLPMSFGFGEGGEQNAPLARAVIGGLLVATFSTLFIVPVVYSLLRKKSPRYKRDKLLQDPDDEPVIEEVDLSAVLENQPARGKRQTAPAMHNGHANGSGNGNGNGAAPETDGRFRTRK